MLSLYARKYSVFFIIPAVTAEKDVKVPDVSNLTLSEAEDELEDAGLVIASEIKDVVSEDIEEGKIVRTDPRAGSTVKEGTSVTLYRSTGVETYTLENYVNMNVNEVSTILKDHGLKVEITEIDPDITTCAVIGQNLVISQSLEEGSEVEAGDTITLTVLKAVTFPDWYLKTADEATEWSNNNCVTLNIEYQQVSNSNEVGKILTQSRPSGSTVKNNDSVTITVGVASEQSSNDNEEEEQEPTDEDKNKEEETEKTE